MIECVKWIHQGLLLDLQFNWVHTLPIFFKLYICLVKTGLLNPQSVTLISSKLQASGSTEQIPAHILGYWLQLSLCPFLYSILFCCRLISIFPLLLFSPSILSSPLHLWIFYLFLPFPIVSSSFVFSSPVLLSSPIVLSSLMHSLFLPILFLNLSRKWSGVKLWFFCKANSTCTF